MLFVATALAASSPCSPSAIAAAAVVSPPIQKSADAVGLTHVEHGFGHPSVQQIAWHGQCTPKIARVYGGETLVTDTGLMLWAREQSALKVRDDRMLPADPEPLHPEWKDRRFVGSTSLVAGSWRIGAWVHRDGTTEIARYRPGDKVAPIILMTSAQPIIGLSYLPAPDTFGGKLFFTQRLGQSQLRMIAMNWSEEGLRTPSN